MGATCEYMYMCVYVTKFVKLDLKFIYGRTLRCHLAKIEIYIQIWVSARSTNMGGYLKLNKSKINLYMTMNTISFKYF